MIQLLVFNLDYGLRQDQFIFDTPFGLYPEPSRIV